MTETVTIPRAEYDRLRAVEEDFEDFRAALAVEARIAAGEEELVPSHVADRLIDGEAPLRVWREYRGLSQSALARVSRASTGCRSSRSRPDATLGSVRTLRKLADALGVAVDDIVAG